jgi:hypothetical protein
LHGLAFRLPAFDLMKLIPSIFPIYPALGVELPSGRSGKRIGVHVDPYFGP